MAERFEKLYTLPSNLYTNGSPIVISAGVLHKDKQTGKIITQLKFQNIYEKAIKALKISLSATDITGEAVVGIENYQYLDLSITPGNIFGADKAIIMPDSNCRAIAISDILVVFNDDTSWSSPGEVFKPLPTPKTLQGEYGAELAKQYQLSTAVSSVYIPQDLFDCWYCSCGTINKGYACSKCHLDKNTIFSALDLATLTEAMEIRLEQERLMKEKIAREKEEAERQELLKNARIKKTASIVLPSIAVIIVFVIILNSVIIPNANYKKAIELKNAEKYEEAIIAFENLDGYRDSNNQIVACETALNEIAYNKAAQTFANGKYEEAYTLFNELGMFKDSGERATESAIKAGDTLIGKNKYDEGIEWYKKVGNSDKANAAKYKYVMAHKNNDDTKTWSYLYDLTKIDYKDADSLYSSLYDWKIELIAFNSDPDSTQHQATISKYAPVYIHFKLTGGTPNASIEPYIKYTLPNGKTGSYDWDYECKDGYVGWYGWSEGIYSTPAYGKEGTLTIAIYPNYMTTYYDPLITIEVPIGS